MLMHKLFGQLVSSCPTTEVRRREHLTYRGNVNSGRHGWLRLTPAYSLNVVQEILSDSQHTDRVLDPFSGTGTTPLLSASLGVQADAVDINPFLVWLGNLKVTSYAPATAAALLSAARQIASKLNRRRDHDGTWVPALHQIEKWWDPEPLAQLAQLRAGIEKVEVSDADIAALLKIAFCRVAIETAHVSFGHQSMSFKARSASQQLSLPNASPSESVSRQFILAATQVADGLTTDEPRAVARVYLGDSRILEDILPRHAYTKVVTSPPYPNRMSYIRELRPYMYWLGYLTNGRQAGEMDWQAIGGTWGCATSNLSTWKPNPKTEIPYPTFSGIVGRIGQDHKLLGRYVHKYFEDIKTHLQSLRAVIASRGSCYYIVGNSKYYGTLLPVHEIYAALFEDTGFKNIQIETLRKRNSKKELYEYIVYAQAP